MKHALIVVAILFSSCTPEQISVESITTDFCECLEEQKSNQIDERAKPCMDKFVNAKQSEINKLYPDKSQEESMREFTSSLLMNLVGKCDIYFMVVDSMYSNMYNVDTSQENVNYIQRLSENIEQKKDKDSISFWLNEKIKKNIEVGNYAKAIQDCDTLKILDSTDYGAYLASAYAYDKLEQRQRAIEEINRAAAKYNKTELLLYSEIIKQRMNN